ERLARAGRGLAGLARGQRGLGQQVEGRRHAEPLADRPAELQSLRSPRLRSGGIAGQGKLGPTHQSRTPDRGRNPRRVEAEERVEPLDALSERAAYDPDGPRGRADPPARTGLSLAPPAT